VTFLVDNQLPAALARFIASLGHECNHVLDLGLEQASDVEICGYAEGRGLILISKDEDFLYLASRADTTLSLIWVRIGNCRNHALLEAFARAWPGIVDCLNAGDRLIELR
jgi:predicted nuclease of predicted toxin-antitoxin system